MKDILHSSTQILPEWILFIGILAVGLSIAFSKENSKWPVYLFSLVTVLYVYSILLSFNQASLDGADLFGGLLHLDKLSLFIKQLAGISAIIFMVHTRLFDYKFPNEIFILVLFVLLGISFLSMTTHFMTMFVSLEMISLTSYVLVASGKTKTNFEASIKYLIFGATASAIMLFGMSFFYGIGHNLNFASEDFLLHVAQNQKGPIQVITFMVLGGFFFKIAAAPFHNWVPEVYETTSTPILSFLSFAPKAVGFVIIARMVMANFTDLTYILSIIIVLSLIVGNFAALWQNNFKRMLGYSGVAQSGFILIGLLKIGDVDFYGTFFYIIVYLPMTMGSFFLVDLIYRKIGSVNIPSMAGLGKKYPLLSANALVILISLVGLPPTVGFMAKLVVFSSLTDTAAVTGNYLFYGLLIFGLLNAAVSLYYYLRPAYFAMIATNQENNSSYSFDLVPTLALSYFSFVLVYFFLSPDSISEWVRSILS